MFECSPPHLASHLVSAVVRQSSALGPTSPYQLEILMVDLAACLRTSLSTQDESGSHEATVTQWDVVLVGIPFPLETKACGKQIGKERNYSGFIHYRTAFNHQIMLIIFICFITGPDS